MDEFRGQLRALKELEKQGVEGKLQAREKYPQLFAAAEGLGGEEALCQRFYLLARLGRSHFDCDEPVEARAKLQEARDCFPSIPANRAAELLPQLLRVLNCLGFLAVSEGEARAGLELLEGADGLWGELREAGSPSKKAEKARTLTLFFLAQTHAQLGNRAESAHFCGLTFERQLAAGAELPLSELTNNALGLAQYYSEQRHFRQALFFLEKARAALPPPPTPEQASLDFMEGNVRRALLEHNLGLVLGGAGEAAQRAEEINAMRMGEREEVRLADSYDGLKGLFAQTMECFERARRVFEDGHITEVCEVVKAQCGLWAAVLAAENEPARREAIHLRRLALLDPLLSSLNPKAYIKHSVELRAIAAEAATSLFELARERNIQGKMTRFGRRAIEDWDVVLAYFAEQPADTAQAVQSFVNCNMSKGRIYAHLKARDRGSARENLVQSLACYSRARDAISDYKAKVRIVDEQMEDQLAAVREFCRLLPAKIQLLS